MIHYDNKARIMFDQIKRSDQKRVQQALQILDQAQHVTETELDVRIVDPADDLYLLAVGPVVRVFFQKNAEKVEVLDIVSQARLDAIHRATAPGVRQ